MPIKICWRLCALTLLLSATQAHAFYFAQGFYHSEANQSGVRLGYHNENPDFFWRSYLSYSPTLHNTPAAKRYGKVDISLDWVLPLPGTYSSAFVGTTLNQTGKPSLQAGITLLKYVELGWQWKWNSRQENQGRERYRYLGLNWAF